MENTEVLTDVMNTVVEEGTEKVLEITPKKIGAVLGVTAIAAGIGYLVWKKPWKKDSKKTEEVVDVEATETKEDSEKPEVLN